MLSRNFPIDSSKVWCGLLSLPGFAWQRHLRSMISSFRRLCEWRTRLKLGLQSLVSQSANVMQYASPKRANAFSCITLMSATVLALAACVLPCEAHSSFRRRVFFHVRRVPLQRRRVLRLLCRRAEDNNPAGL